MIENEVEGEGFDLGNLESEVSPKIDNYFASKNNELLSYENLDEFLKAIELYELWNSEEEKDEFWQSLMKYGTDNKVDAEGAKKGLHDLLNKVDEEYNQDDNGGEKKENKEVNLLTRISIYQSSKNEGTMNKLVLNKYKQKAYDEYDSLDITTLIQFKRIFKLLNIDEENKNIISIETINKIVEKNKFIKLDKNEIIKYIHFLSCDDKPLEEITSITINNTIYSEIDALLQEKLIDEDLDKLEEDEEGDGEKEEDPLEILDELQHKIESSKDNSLALIEMKNSLDQTSQNISASAIKIIKESNEENQSDNINIIEEMGFGAKEKMDKFDECILNMKKDQQSTLKRLHTLKKSIVHLNNEMNTLKEDYKNIYEKYNNNQQLEADEQMERLLDENITLNQEINTKKDEISQLLNEMAEKDKKINELYLKLDEGERLESDLKKQVNELKVAVSKSKEDYDNLMDNVMNKLEKKENEEKMERNKIKQMIENQLKTEGNKENSDNKSHYIDIKALNDIDNMNIPLTDKLMKKKQILSQLSNEQLMEYTLKLERLNINLKSIGKKKEQKIKELEENLDKLNTDLTKNKKEIGSLKIEITKNQKIISNLQKEVKANEAYRPSIAMNAQMRVSRISKLNTDGLNTSKFKGLHAENEIKNSNDYFKNMSIKIEGKKQIQSSKLKDNNTKEKPNKKHDTNFSPQNIMNSIYGDDKIDEKDNEEDAEQKPQKDISENDKDNINEIKEKKDFEVSKNAETIIEDEKNNFSPTQNGIEYNIQSEINMNQEGGEIVVDNINDINLGGNDEELFDKKDGENTDEKEKSQNKFFDTKPETNENNFQINGENKEDDNIIEGERDTIQVKNNNQMEFGGLADVLMEDIENNEESEEEQGKEENKLGRVSEFVTEIKTENKFGLNLDNKKKTKSLHDNNIKSSGDIMQFMNSKNLLEKAANKKENKNNLEIKNNDEINIKNNKEQKNNNLGINPTNQINLQQSESNNMDDFVIVENINSNIIKEPNKDEKKQVLDISDSNNININNIENIDNNNKNIIIKENQNVPCNNSSIAISSKINIQPSQNNIQINNNNSKNKITFEQVSNSNIIINEKNPPKKEKEKDKAQIENNNYDYYSLFHEDFVKQKLSQKKDNSTEKDICSDQIYLLTGKKKLEKRLLLITLNYIYIIEPKEPRFELIFDKSELDRIAISNLNLSILIFVRNKEDNIIILTLRRMDLLNFIKDQYTHSNKSIKFSYEDKFNMRIKGKITELSVKDKIFSSLSNFDGAIKIGYLLKMNTNLFKIFSERLVALTSLGLLVFTDPHKPPERLYPIIGSKINRIFGNKYKRPNCFEILTPNGNIKVFAAYKERELNSWLEEFEKVREDFRKKMTKLDTVNKVEFIDNKNDLFKIKEEEDEEE